MRKEWSDESYDLCYDIFLSQKDFMCFKIGFDVLDSSRCRRHL